MFSAVNGRYPISHSSYEVADPHFSRDQEVEIYANNSELQWNAAIRIIGLYGLKGNEEIIDFACGDGKVTDYFSKNTEGHVFGFDVSPNMIKKASETYIHDRLSFKIGDMTTFSSEKKYTLAHAGYCLHYGDAQQTLVRIFDILIGGGTALITLPGKFDQSLAFYADKISKSEKWSHHFVGFSNQRKYYNPEEFTQLLHEAGFIPKHVEARLQKITFPSRQAICDFYLPVSAQAKYLRLDLRREFINDLINMVLTENGCKVDQEPFIYQNTLEVIALKPRGSSRETRLIEPGERTLGTSMTIVVPVFRTGHFVPF